MMSTPALHRAKKIKKKTAGEKKGWSGAASHFALVSVSSIYLYGLAGNKSSSSIISQTVMAARSLVRLTRRRHLYMLKEGEKKGRPHLETVCDLFRC